MLVSESARRFLKFGVAAWLLILPGCGVAIGAGVGATAIGVAALTAGCYDAVDVRLIDAASGLRHCAARVTAVSSEGSETAFASCYHAALPRGDWSVRAEQPGYSTASARVLVERGSSCEPAVQSVEIVIYRAGTGPVRAPSVPAPPLPATPAPASPPVAPAPAETAPASPAAAPDAPSTPSGAVPTAPQTVPPAPGTAPSPPPAAPGSAVPSAPAAPPAPPPPPAAAPTVAPPSSSTPPSSPRVP